MIEIFKLHKPTGLLRIQTIKKLLSTMNTIHFIAGNRGNIGKSLFCSLVCHFYSSNGRPFTLFDTDPDKQDVSSLYGGIRDVTFDACNEIMVNHSTDAIKVDRIYEEALKQDVIVNMPSNSHKELLFWLTQNGLNQAEFLTAEKIQIYIWYLSNGDDTSLNLFKTLVDNYPAFKIALVQNKGIDHQWSQELNADMKKAIETVQQLDLSTMPRSEREATFASGKAYAKYISNTKSSKLSVNRLKTYLDNECAKFIKIFSLANPA